MYTLTEFLGLRRPVKGTSQQYDSDVYSADLTTLDAKLKEHDDDIIALQGAGANAALGFVADLTALAAATPARGSQYTVQAASFPGISHDPLFLRINGAWRLISPVLSFATKTNLDSFVTAASTYFVPGQRFWTVADGGYEWLWLGAALEPTRIVQATTAPANPVVGQLFIDTDA